ncbi:MAG: zinc carboxypeptidase, partial [Flavobacteriaceae bacterium]|nr:zinc carboxypeptidase [Flavobacteriaceae bacterium]
DRGSLVITKSDNRSNQDFHNDLVSIANAHERELFAATSSFGDLNTDFGSPDIKMVNKQRIAMLRGDGVSSLSYGALWHFFEQQLNYPVTSMDTSYFDPSMLSEFDVLILPSGWYSKLMNEDKSTELKDWIRAGGKVIALGNAVSSFAGKDGFGLKRNQQQDSNTEDGEDEVSAADNLIPYDQREKNNVKNLITGSIYKTTLDPSHPMAFGYDDTYFSLKLGSSSYAFLENGYNVGYIKGDAESVAGFSGADAKAKLKNSLSFGEVRLGSGSVIYLVDDVLFRSFWENGKMLLVNSIFFVNNNKFTL